jgi:sugar/nucleoside kinase (ribokinase family)
MISVVGHTAVDHISRVPHLPEKNCSTHIAERQIYFGGGAANIAAGIASLGEQVTLISCIGSDFYGGDYDRWMKSLGIHQQFYVVPDAHTPTAFMFTDDAGDQMTFFEWGASKAFATAEAPSLPFVHMATADPELNSPRLIPDRTFSGIQRNNWKPFLPTPTSFLQTSTRSGRCAPQWV